VDPAFTNWLDTNEYVQSETDPVWTSEKANYATGTPVYAESDPVWVAERSNYATGTPLYAFSEVDPAFTNWLDTNEYVQSETDPVWASEKANYATGTPVYAESDPVWLAERSNYATGTPLYAFSEVDPAYQAEKSRYATGTPVYAESDPLWSADKPDYFTATQADTRYLIGTNDLSELNDAAAARTNLGLGTLAVQQADAVAISGGVLDGVTLTNVTLTLNGSALSLETPDDFALLGNIGTNTLQLGGSTSKVLIPGDLTVSGTQTVINSSILNVSTNFVLINKDGTAGSALGAGFFVEVDGTRKGYFKMDDSEAARLQLKAVGGSNLWIVATNRDVTLEITDDIQLPGNFATGMPVYAETDPIWASEKANYATGTPVYAESDPIWLTERSNYATGTPLYAFSEVDPAFTNWLDTNEYVQSETDPVWLAEKANYATGTPVYVESDPVWAAEKSDYVAETAFAATTNALQQQIDDEETGRLAADAALSNDVTSLQSGKLDSSTWSAADSTTNYLPRTGGTMTGNLTVGGSVTVNGAATFNNHVDVEGRLTVGTNAVSPQAGTMRWNPATTNFEGYTGTEWRPLGNVYSD
jgi:hypothetical protein